MGQRRYSLGTKIPAREFADQLPGAKDNSRSLSYQAYLAMTNTIGVGRVLFTTDTPYASMKAAGQCYDQMPIDVNDKKKKKSIVLE